jgi:hypothetical protein
VIMHDEALEFRIEQVDIAAGPPVAAGCRTGRNDRALLLSIRTSAAGALRANSAPDARQRGQREVRITRES